MLVLVLLELPHSFLFKRAVVPAELALPLEIKFTGKEGDDPEVGK
jgi:hypothetical protein